MVANMVGIVIYAVQSIGMTVSYIIGIQDPFRCDVLYFTLFPVIVIMYTLIGLVFRANFVNLMEGSK